MSKNKWNNTEVIKQSLNEAYGETLKEILSKDKIVVEENPVSIESESIPEVPLLTFGEGRVAGFNEIIHILEKYPKNMTDDTYSISTQVVSDWLKIILSRRGYKL